jgi:hypothetical protein
MSTLMQAPNIRESDGDSRALGEATATIPRRAAAFAKSFVRDPLAHWPFVAISRLAFGNTTGFRQNFYGSLNGCYHRFFARRADEYAIDAEVREMAAGLRENDIALANGWLDAGTMTSVREQILPLAEKIGDKAAYITTLEGQEIEANIPQVFEFLTDKMTAVAEEYFGSPFQIGGMSFRLTQHVPNEILRKAEVYSNRWHFDSVPTSQLAIFIILNDISTADGPTAALPLSGSKEMVKRGYRYRNTVDDTMLRALEDHPSKAEFIGPAGTVLFANTATCLHRAGIPEHGRHREWLEFRLYPCRDATNKNRISTPGILKWTHGINPAS